MNLLRRSARNIVIVASSQLATWAIALVFTLAQARVLGAARFGELSLALAYAAFLTIVVDLGLGMHVGRLVARNAREADGAFVSTLIIRGALWLAAMPLLWFATALLGYDAELRDTILLLAASVLFVSLASAVGAYLQGREEFLVPSLANVAYRLGAAAVGMPLLLLGYGVVPLALAYILASIASLAVIAIGFARSHPVREVASARPSAHLLRLALPLAVYWIVGNFYFNVDMALLEHMAPRENVGWYAAAYRLFNAAAIVPAIVTGIVLYPVFARLAVETRELRSVVTKAFTLLAIAGIAAALVLRLFAEPLVALLYPAGGYGPTANALRLLAPGLAFLYVNSALAYALLALHQEARMARMALVAAVFNVVLNLVAIPAFAQDGAALVTTLTEVLLFAWLVRMMPQELFDFRAVWSAARAVTAAIAAAAVATALSHQPFAVVLACALVSYAAFALLVRAIAREDLIALRDLIRPRPVVAVEAVAMVEREAS